MFTPLADEHEMHYVTYIIIMFEVDALLPPCLLQLTI